MLRLFVIRTNSSNQHFILREHMQIANVGYKVPLSLSPINLDEGIAPFSKKKEKKWERSKVRTQVE